MSLNTSTTAIGTTEVHGSVLGVFLGSPQLSPFWGGSSRRALSTRPPPPPGKRKPGLLDPRFEASEPSMEQNAQGAQCLYEGLALHTQGSAYTRWCKDKAACGHRGLP